MQPAWLLWTLQRTRKTAIAKRRFKVGKHAGHLVDLSLCLHHFLRPLHIQSFIGANLLCHTDFFPSIIFATLPQLMCQIFFFMFYPLSYISLDFCFWPWNKPKKHGKQSSNSVTRTMSPDCNACCKFSSPPSFATIKALGMPLACLHSGSYGGKYQIRIDFGENHLQEKKYVKSKQRTLRQ